MRLCTYEYMYYASMYSVDYFRTSAHCMYKCMHACMYVYMYVCSFECLYVCMYVCMSINIAYIQSDFAVTACTDVYVLVHAICICLHLLSSTRKANVITEKLFPNLPRLVLFRAFAVYTNVHLYIHTYIRIHMF